MSKLQHLFQDFSRRPIPDEQTVGAIRIALVLIAVAIALPAFLTGMELGRALGLEAAATAMFAGGLLLALVGSFTSIVGASTRLSTYMLILYAFGRRGGQIVNLVLALSLFGWFGVLGVMFARASQNAMIELWGMSPALPVLVLLGGVLMVATTVWGFQALDRLSIVVTPAKIILLCATVWAAVDQFGWAGLSSAPTNSMSLGDGVSVVAGGLMVGATLMPDLSRYARSRRDGVLAVVLGYGVGFPLVLLASAIPPLLTGQADLIEIMLVLGLGIPAMAVLVLATWTTNAYNLYAGSLVAATIFTRAPYWLLAVICGMIGTLVAFTGVADLVVPYLIVLAITIPPIAGIYVVEFLVSRRADQHIQPLESEPDFRVAPFVAWGAGVALAAATAYGPVQLSTIPALDSLAASIFVRGLLLALSPPRRMGGAAHG